MKIADNQTDREVLAAIGADAINLLRARDFSALADRFGYALAFGRDLSVAIGEDLATSLVQFSDAAYGKISEEPRIAVKYFNPNASSLFALIECFVQFETGSAVLLELVVTSTEEGKYVSLEQISAAA